jgi:hypothetical protein
MPRNSATNAIITHDFMANDFLTPALMNTDLMIAFIGVSPLQLRGCIMRLYLL